MKTFLKTIAVGLIIGAIFINVYLSRENYMANTNIIKTQAMILQLQAYFNEINVKRNILLEEKINRDNDNMEVYLGALESKIDLKTQTDEYFLKEIQNGTNIFENHILKQLNKLEKQISEEESKPSFEYLKSVTVRMINYKDKEQTMSRTGTGSIIKVTEDFTYILTNRHVAPMDSQYLFIEKDGKKYKGRVLKNGVIRDLSLVRMVGKIPNTSVVKGFSKVKEQDKIYSVGMYLGLHNIYTEGTVAGWKKENRLINLPCLYGCSGSAVFDKNGNMVAVVYAGTQYSIFGAMDTAKAICVPYIGIMAFLEEIL